MTDDAETRRRRAAYRASHRGTKEMDWVLGRFAEQALADMAGARLAAFEELLELPDPVLHEMVMDGVPVADAGARRAGRRDPRVSWVGGWDVSAPSSGVRPSSRTSAQRRSGTQDAAVIELLGPGSAR